MQVWLPATLAMLLMYNAMLSHSTLVAGDLNLEAQNELFDGSMKERYDKLLQLLQNLGLMRGVEAQHPGQRAWQPQHGLFKRAFELATHARIEVCSVGTLPWLQILAVSVWPSLLILI